MENINISLELLARLTKNSKTELGDALESLKNEEGELKQAEIDNLVNAKIVNRFKEITDQSIGRGTREALSSKEKVLAEKFGVEKTGDIVNLVDSIVSNIKGEKSKFTVEDAFKMPEVQAKLKEFKEQAKEANTKINETIKQYEQKSLLDNVMNNAWNLVAAKNPVLPEDENAKKNLIQYFKQQVVNGANFKNEDGKIVVVDDAGEKVIDQNYEQITFDKYVLSKSLFDFQEKNKTKKGTTFKEKKAYSFSAQDFENAVNYQRQLLKDGDPEKRNEFLKQWREWQKTK